MRYHRPLHPIHIIIIIGIVCVIGSVRSDTDVDICIIGAGPAGIQAAYSAEAKGYSVAVFEKNAEVALKTKAINIPSSSSSSNHEGPYYMGAAIHIGNNPNNLDELAKEFGVKDLGVTVPEIKVGWFRDDKVDDGYKINYFRLIPEGLKFIFIRSYLSRYIDAPDGYLSDYPKELERLSFMDWLQDNGMPTLSDIFWQYMTTYGYNHPRDIPALFGLKYGSSSSLINVLIPFGLSKLVLFPYQELLQRMANSLQGTIYLEADIVDVTYKESHTRLHYSLRNAAPSVQSTSSISCGSTIIAFAPTAEAMTLFTPPDDTGELTDLFGQVKTTNYYTLLFDDPRSAFDDGRSFKYHVPETAVPDNPARNLFYWKQQEFPGSSVSGYYLSPSEKSDEEALNESLSHYSNLVGRTATEVQVQDFNAWEDYFPHVSSSSLQHGFFHRFASFQGHYGQYYTGGLFNMDRVQDAMEHARYIIETEF